jgi:hypothetical protein
LYFCTLVCIRTNQSLFIKITSRIYQNYASWNFVHFKIFPTMHLSYKKAYLGLDHFPSPAFLNWTLYTGTTSHPLHSSTGLCIQALLPIPCIPRLDSVYRHYFPSPAFLDWTLYTGTTSHPLHSSTGLCIQALLPIPCIPRLDSVYSVCIEIVCASDISTQAANSPLSYSTCTQNRIHFSLSLQIQKSKTC